MSQLVIDRSRTSKIDSRMRSVVGRVAMPGAAGITVRLNAPAMMRMMRRGLPLDLYVRKQSRHDRGNNVGSCYDAPLGLGIQLGADVAKGLQAGCFNADLT